MWEFRKSYTIFCVVKIVKELLLGLNNRWWNQRTGQETTVFPTLSSKNPHKLRTKSAVLVDLHFEPSLQHVNKLTEVRQCPMLSGMSASSVSLCCFFYFIWGSNGMLSTPLCNARNFTAQQECALKMVNVELIQSFSHANYQARGMCLSALGWAVFAVLRVSSLDSWETGLLSSRDEHNTWQMFEEAKQQWRRRPDISLVEAVIWRGNRVVLESRGQGQVQMNFKGWFSVCMCVLKFPPFLFFSSAVLVK